MEKEDLLLNEITISNWHYSVSIERPKLATLIKPSDARKIAAALMKAADEVEVSHA